MKTRGHVIGLAVGCIAAVLPAAATADEGSVWRASENLRLNSDPSGARAHEMHGLGSNPADPSHLVEMDFDLINESCETNVSFDGGLNWSSGFLPAPAGFPDPPCYINNGNSGGRPAHGSVKFGTGRNVYTTFTSEKADQRDSIIVARSVDGGRTWDSVVAIPNDQDDYRRPKLGVMASPAGDRVYVAGWKCGDITMGNSAGACGAVAVATSTDGGRTFGRPVVLQAAGESGYDNTEPVITPDGTVHVAYRRHGASPIGASTADDTLVLASSPDRGQTWTRTAIANRLIPAAGFADPNLAADSATGALYALYDNKPSIDSTDPDIRFQRSVDGGRTWSSPLRVNDDPVDGRVDQRAPSMSVSANGQINVVWWDRRHPYPGQAMEDVYYAASNDGGQSFLPNRRLTDRSNNRDLGHRGNLGTFAPSSAPLEDGALVTWSETRQGNYDTDNQDMFLSRLTNVGGEVPVRTLAADGPPALAAAISKLAYPGGAETVGTGGNAAKMTKVVVVEENDADAAGAAAVLARAHLGPVLLAGQTGLSEETKAEVTRLAPAGAFLVGGESLLGPRVIDDLVAAGVAREAISRLAGSTPAETARRVAEKLDSRSDAARSQGNPAFPAAVIVNPSTSEAAAGSALAASLRYPVLLVNADAVPAATKEALTAFGVRSTLVVGGPAVVSDAVLAELPAPKRLGGEGPVEVSESVAVESRERGLPVNVSYLADSAHPVEASVLGGAIGRLGGLLLLSAGARSPARPPGTDRMVAAVLNSPGATTAGDPAVAIGASPGLVASEAQHPATGGTPGRWAGLAMLACGLGIITRRYRGTPTRKGMR